MDTDGTLDLSLVNDAGAFVTITKVKASIVDINLEDSGCIPYTTTTHLNSGDIELMSISGCKTGEVGETYEAEVTITYENPVTQVIRSSRGRIWGFYEPTK